MIGLNKPLKKKIADAFRDIADGLLSHADEIDAANFE